eukprot:scaffold30237_cov19-Prasinocladus_malaysianus.AAC.2
MRGPRRWRGRCLSAPSSRNWTFVVRRQCIGLLYELCRYGINKDCKGIIGIAVDALTGNNIGDEGAKELASRLPLCTGLQHLDLRGKAPPHEV